MSTFCAMYCARKGVQTVTEALVFAPGDRVWFSTRNLPFRLPCRKLGPRFMGPFKVLRRVNKVCYRLQLPPDYHINPSFHVSLLRPVVAGPLQESEVREVPPPPLDIEGAPSYSVRSTLDSRGRARGLQYLMDWEGYGPEKMLGSVGGRIGSLYAARLPPSPSGSPCTSPSGSSPRSVSTCCWIRVSGGYCHDFCPSRSLSLFGRCSAVDVTDLLPITDPFSIGFVSSSFTPGSINYMLCI
uniref:Tf2-1-like SH3-like domain-containing protein n=1 Tax=Oncorhynchus tshawytscha TaxID=74940 RepID=A0AAZ3S6X6_ONCTS